MNLIQSGRLAVALGGPLTRELLQNGGMGDLWAELDSNRLVYVYDEVELEKETRLIAERCRSNDAHIIARARISGARVLYSHDHDLHNDFRNRVLVRAPRGSIYQSAEHVHWLRNAPGCKKSRNDAGG